MSLFGYSSAFIALINSPLTLPGGDDLKRFETNSCCCVRSMKKASPAAPTFIDSLVSLLFTFTLTILQFLFLELMGSLM
jgi:hypothetical protein